MSDANFEPGEGLLFLDRPELLTRFLASLETTLSRKGRGYGDRVLRRRSLLNVPIALLLTAPLLAGCFERGEPLPMSNVSTQDDDMYCRAGGKNAPGSPDYVYCRRDRDAQRNAAVVRADKKQRDLGEYMLNNPR